MSVSHVTSPQGLRKIEGIHIEGVPDVSIVAVASNEFNIFRLSTALGQKGWSLNALQVHKMADKLQFIS